MKEPLSVQISQLTMKREQNKLALFEKEALRLRNKELFFVHGESLPVEQRIALDSEIAHLEADRQRTKVELLKLKRQAQEMRETKLLALLIEALNANGLQAEIEKARAAADDALRHAELFEAYATQI